MSSINSVFVICLMVHCSVLVSPQLQQQPPCSCVFTLRIKANDDYKLLLSEEEKECGACAADGIKTTVIMEIKKGCVVDAPVCGGLFI